MKLETKLEQVVKELNRRFGSTTTTEITVNNGETDTTYQAKYFTYFRKVVETTTHTYYGNTSSKEERTVGKRSWAGNCWREQPERLDRRFGASLVFSRFRNLNEAGKG